MTETERVVPPSARGKRDAIAEALAAASYEILPLRGTAEKVLTTVPCTVPLTVTVTEANGLEPTVALAERLTAEGYRAAPHIAARLVRDDEELARWTQRLTAAGVEDVFVVGGDAPHPRGEFPDALSLLQAMADAGRSFRTVGIGGYPEGHGIITDTDIWAALTAKAPFATHLVTQLCFSATATAGWADALRDEGVTLPVKVGIPGVVSRKRLVRISAGLGLGQSARFLLKQQSLFWRFFLPGGYSPDRLVTKLSPVVADPHSKIAGFHIFTFNDLEATERWRCAWLARLGR